MSRGREVGLGPPCGWAAVRFLSCEPLRGPLEDLGQACLAGSGTDREAAVGR